MENELIFYFLPNFFKSKRLCFIFSVCCGKKKRKRILSLFFLCFQQLLRESYTIHTVSFSLIERENAKKYETVFYPQKKKQEISPFSTVKRQKKKRKTLVLQRVTSSPQFQQHLRLLRRFILFLLFILFFLSRDIIRKNKKTEAFIYENHLQPSKSQ